MQYLLYHYLAGFRSTKAVGLSNSNTGIQQVVKEFRQGADRCVRVGFFDGGNLNVTPAGQSKHSQTFLM